ncbi:MULTISPECIES: lysine N(6)-hydroxylase/L-ornithine N(5)-oxygenase family protein [unclassified Streptomyces]|uniref:lysine N(6)-hydroxylase/L-ornithine N(5)-oxygenase family protein n=1 Tax=unclassified Streptomyces TaxID=2593676 RepID=UPI00136B910E|nr:MULTISPECIES: lysine N(6)-hydroxylase/L-ornithine N(5)-oxygenase family protein [unclassified Streptomyces]NEA04994.1 lysine N(6)-hydroxylase/L-ornithine N(5)-oxygenase family protein [Streptomyces sp. SID10116]MYY86336.1 SidA/IucD/PvdA family monooxygenase [Streptomyces sp. SID335]MYZ13204.1 SidA/IucD/PvdA family monooxygenase [Streptomyces sp. SID337]NDZ92166.1 lysine N(6)-hydroxylase/L-ornithine N(5)-oxygenase family protein [Streptomyces sp. SID10115]NEB48700.1 lysine N(6)-hydroxylase/L
MSQVLPGDDAPLVHDLIGIGFGPSNVAMAIALSEHNASVGREETVTAHFFEQQPSFGWHRGMLIDDATMQVSFLKDLVTQRNPTSEFSFLCYLKSKGRLTDFINHKNLFPLRVEFHDYLEWAAAKVDDQVSYGHEVVGVTPFVRDGVVEYLDVTVRSAEGLAVHRARNLVIGTGLRPLMPEGVERGDRVWHNSELLAKVEGLEGTSPTRFVVVGAGQSAAENVAYLHRCFPEAEICAVFSRYGYSPADDSSFANRIFDPDAVDEYFEAPEGVKRRLMDYHGNTNYSVVDIDLIDDLYRESYREKVLGTERLRFLNVSRLTGVKETPDGVQATVKSLVTGEENPVDADVVVFATGYSPADPVGLLGEVADRCLRDDEGRVRVERDYRVATDADLRCGIYLQGGTEHTHGITSSLLSNIAIRVGEILDSVRERGAASAEARPVAGETGSAAR